MQTPVPASQPPLRNLIVLALGALALAGTTHVRAESEPGLPSVEDFFRFPETIDEQLSPSGQYLAILGRGESGRMRLAIIDLASADKHETRFSYQKVDIRSFHWVSDKRIVFDIWDSTGDHDSEGFGGLFAIDRDGSKFAALISPDYRYRREASEDLSRSNIRPSTDSFFSRFRDDSDDIVVSELKVTGGRQRQKVLRRLNTRTQELSDLSAGQPEGTFEWWLDPDGLPRVAAANADVRRVVYGRRQDLKTWAVLADFDRYAAAEFAPRFLAFDGALYAERKSPGALFRYDLAQGTFDAEPVFRLEGFDLAPAPQLDSKARKLVGFHYMAEARRALWLDPRIAGYQKSLDASLPKASNRITCGNCLSANFLLIESSSDRQPAQYYVFDAAASKLLRVGAQRPSIKPAQMGRRDFVRYPARDGRSIPAYVTLPPERYPKPYPLVVLVHDWPVPRQTSWEWDPRAQFLASRGYAVIQPEYRGSAGFGFEHFKAGWRQLGLAMQDDLADAARWAVAQGIADANRIAIAGAGIGGYASLMGLVRNPDIFKCAVQWGGVTDLGLLYTDAWGDASEVFQDYGAAALVGDPAKDAEQLKAASPLQNAQRITQPVLMAYGARDLVVPLSQGEKLRSALATPKDKAEWIVYPRDGHEWTIEKDNIDFWTRVDKFLEKNLKSLPHANP